MVRSEGTRGGITREREKVPLKSGINEKKKKEDGMRQSQKLFLTWLIEDERLFVLTEDYIGPDDFTEDIFREAAAVFHARLHPMESRQEREKALKETILRIKKHSMDVRSRNLDPTDLAGLQKIVEDKKQLAILQKMHISLD